MRLRLSGRTFERRGDMKRMCRSRVVRGLVPVALCIGAFLCAPTSAHSSAMAPDEAFDLTQPVGQDNIVIYPWLIKKEAPHFPRQARKATIDYARLIITVLIDKTGRIIEVKILDCTE